MPKGSALGAVILAVSFAEPSGAGEFGIAAQQLTQRVRVVALTPCANDGEYELPAAVVARWEEILDAELRAAGVATVASSEYRASWRKLAEAVGGAYDPVSGQRDEAKWQSVREHTLRDLQRQHRVDAVLDCSAWDVRGRPPDEGRAGLLATWRAAGQLLTVNGSELRFVKNVRLVILAVQLRDRGDSLLYRAAADVDWVSVRNEGVVHERAASELFAAERDEAVRLLLEPVRAAYRDAAGGAQPTEAR